MSDRVYLDAASGQPWATAAKAVLAAASELGFALPQATHSEAARTRQLRDSALHDLAHAWQVDLNQILPVHGLSNAFKAALPGGIESVAVSAGARAGMLQAVRGYGEWQSWQLQPDGQLNPDDYQAEIICVQAGNPETGVIDDLAELRERFPSSRLVVDASEWAGRMPGLPEADVLIFRASSWAGPASVCFVVSTRPLNLHPRARLGLAPDPVLLAAATAAWQELGDIKARAAMQRELLANFAGRLRPNPRFTIFDQAPQRLPHLLSVAVAGWDGEALANKLDRHGFAVGSGSACTVDETAPSKVLAAMGFADATSVRIGLPLNASEQHLSALADVLLAEVGD